MEREGKLVHQDKMEKTVFKVKLVNKALKVFLVWME